MSKKPKRKDANPEVAQAEERIEAIRAEIAEALVQRNELPGSASDEEKAAAAGRVEQLQARYHEAVQHLLTIKRQETAKLERQHKERKLRHKRLKAACQPGSHAAPQEESITTPRHRVVHPLMDRAPEEAQMDAANEEDLFLQRRELEEEEERESAEDLAHRRRIAEKRRRKEEAARLREARKRKRMEAEAKAEAARIKEEKESRAKIRQEAALKRAQEAKEKKRQQRAQREARQRAIREVRALGWLNKVLRLVRTLLGGRR